MAREDFVGRRAYHEDSGKEGVCLDVNLAKQTALFHRDGTEAKDARWVNLYKLEFFPPDDESSEG